MIDSTSFFSFWDSNLMHIGLSISPPRSLFFYSQDLFSSSLCYIHPVHGFSLQLYLICYFTHKLWIFFQWSFFSPFLHMPFFLESIKFLLSKTKQMKKPFSVFGVSHLRSEHSEGSSRWTSLNLRPMFSRKDGLVSLCFVPYYNNLLAYHFPSQLQSLLYSEISLPWPRISSFS